MFANLGAPGDDEPGRPLPAFWWVRGATYAVGYGLSVAAVFTAAGFIYSSLRGNRFPIWLDEPGWYFLINGLIPFLYCHFLSGVAGMWREQVVERHTPHRYLFVVGATCGSLIGAAHFGFSVFPHHGVKEVAVVLLFVAGPSFGIWWLVRDKTGVVDEDYDDLMPNRHSPDRPVQIDLPDLAATEVFGRRLGGLLFPNAVVALVGPLGAGKTHLTRAVAEGLGIANPAAVTSPTFTLVHEYPARLPIYHFDAYRLNGPNEFLDLGVTEYYEAGGVCLIEWADKVESALPPERLTIRLRPVDENRRVAQVVGTGENYQSIARALASAAA
jgi:tRNA threonylcarbamoyladenosine biosynthesis protein TsaE